ncbi:hypothetical protein BurJ1DRAFT_1276 [Burkholderiales bacterium JOSHI_001]|nr:hypothetical protein BurJ1DRAFT_1276 [Burkholderiales bacterium JOSHI_001]
MLMSPAAWRRAALGWGLALLAGCGGGSSTEVPVAAAGTGTPVFAPVAEEVANAAAAAPVTVAGAVTVNAPVEYASASAPASSTLPPADQTAGATGGSPVAVTVGSGGGAAGVGGAGTAVESTPAAAPTASAPVATTETTTTPAPTAPLPTSVVSSPATTTVPISGSTVVNVSTTPPTASVYIDSASGNDANPGTELQPWRTLSRLSGLLPQPGQAVYLRCGSVWRESLLLASGQLGANANIAGYGHCAGNPPRILGADDFSGGWTRSGNIWSRALPAGTPAITQLFVGGVRHRLAQWPNHGGLGAEYALLGSATMASRSSAVLGASDLAALAGRNLVGARLYVRSEPWCIERRSVAGWNSTTGALTLDQTTEYAMEAGDGIVLAGQAWMLDAAGEFFHDVAAQRLYVIASNASAQANLNLAQVDGSVRDWALLLRGVSGLTVQGLAVGMASNTGLTLEDTPGAVVRDILAHDNGDVGVRVQQNAISAPGQASVTIASSRAEGNVNMGIDASAAAGVVVRDSQLRNTGTLGAVDGSLAAIKVGPGASVLNNRIVGSAYHGVYFNGDDGTQVSGNFITDYCLRLTDCGAIYTWNGSGTSRTSTSRSSTVSANRVAAASPNVEGAVGAGRDVVAGIFLDDKTSGVTVRGNQLAGMPIGIGVHNSFNNRVESNEVLLTSRASISLGMDLVDGSGTDYLRGNVINGNRLLPARQGSGAFPALPSMGNSVAVDLLHRLHGSTAINGPGGLSFANNRISLMHGNSLPVASVTGGGGTSQWRLSQWRVMAPLDLSDSAVRFALFQPDTGPELLPNGGFDVDAQGWGTNFSKGSSGSSHLDTGVPGCSGNCLTFSTGSVLDSMIGGPLSLSAGLPHLVSFTAVYGATGQVADPYIFKASSPWNNVVDANGLRSWMASDGLAGDVQDYMAIFVPAQSDPAQLALKVASANVPVSFDNVSVRRLLGYGLSRPADYAVVVHAEAGASTVVACAGLGWPAGCSALNLDGLPVALPATQSAGTSVLYLRSDSTWRR